MCVASVVCDGRAAVGVAVAAGRWLLLDWLAHYTERNQVFMQSVVVVSCENRAGAHTVMGVKQQGNSLGCKQMVSSVLCPSSRTA